MTSDSTNRQKAKAAGLDKRGNRTHLETAIAAVLFACALISVATTFAVVYALAEPTISFFREVSLIEFFTNTEWTPLFLEKNYGIAPLVAGTMLVTVIAMIVGLPLGLGSAIYLSEFADAEVRRRVIPVLEILAGIPTVVLGYFALLFVTPILRDLIPGLNLFNALSAGIVMGFMILPTVSSLSTDAMRAVPGSLREAAYGLGASKYEVVVKVVVPAALSGIVASFILAMARAIGETMIVTLAAGQKPTLTFDPRETIATMTSFIVQAGTGDQPTGSLAARALFAVASTLFVITLGLNLLAQRIVLRFQEKYE